MADTAIAITAGTGTNVDTRTEGTNGNHRQVVVLGDPATNAGVAPVDATAGLKVDLGADNDITGTVTANLGATDNAVLDAIEADTTTIAGAVSGTEMQVDIVTSALPSGASTSAKQDTQITAEQAIQTSVELIDDTIRAEDVASADGHKGVVMMAVRQDTPANTSATDGDYEMPKMSAGRMWVDASGKTLTVDGSGVTQPVSNAGLTELAAAINSSKVDVNIVSSDVASGGTSAADDADFTAGTTTGTPSMGVYESTPTSVTDGDLGTVGITSGRRLKTSATIDAALPAGTNAIGKLASNTGVDIGDVDVLSSALPTGASTSAKQDTVIGHLDGVETLLTTIAGDTTDIEAALETVGGLVVNLGTNNDVTVTGTVDLGATDNAVLDAIAASTAAIETAVEGTLTVTGGGGGVEYTEDAAAAADPVGGALIMVRDDALSGQTTTDGDNVAARGTDKGELYVKHTDTIAVTQSGTWDEVGINDSGNSITVDATNLDIRDLVNTDVVTAELSAIDNAVLDTIAAKDFATQTTLAAMNAKMVTGTDIGDVTINNAAGAAAVNIQDGGNTITVDGTVTANLAAGTNNIGDVDILSIAAGDNNIGNVDIVSGTITTVSAVTAISNALPAGTNALGKLLPPDVDVTAHTNYARKYYTNAGAVTDGIVWSPAAGKRWHVVTMYIQTSAAATITLEDDKAGGDDPVWKGEIAANSGVTLSFTEKYPMASGEDAADLIVTTSAGNVYITCVGYEI